MITRTLVLSFLASFCHTVCGLAQPTNEIPAVVVQGIEKQLAGCGNPTPLILAPAIFTIDINEDGRVDYIVNFNAILCTNTPSKNCGTGGCLQQFWVSRNDGWHLALEQSGQIAGIDRVNGKSALRLAVHHGYCGDAPCFANVVWTEQRLVLVPVRANSSSVRTAVANVQEAKSHVGRWYDESPSECKPAPGNPQETLDYTQTKKIHGHEYECRILRTTNRGPTVELALRCSGEGITVRETEWLQVINGRLHVMTVTGRKRTTKIYRRCP